MLKWETRVFATNRRARREGFPGSRTYSAQEYQEEGSEAGRRVGRRRQERQEGEEGEVNQTAMKRLPAFS